MATSASTTQHPVARRIAWVVGGFIAFLVLLILVLSLLSDSLWKHLIEKTLSSKTGREVKIEGPLHVRVWRWTPELTMDGFTLGNANWIKDRPMLSMKHFEATVTWGSILRLNPVFPRILIEAPDAALERDSSNRANW